jgi:serine/threonine-protein kinase
MSPEQVLGAKDVDFRSDLWALAVCTYNMMTGKPAFVASTPHALFFTICKGAYTPLSEHHTPEVFARWFERSFQPNKEKRFGSAREMVLRFEACVAELDEDESTQTIAPSKTLQALGAFAKGKQKGDPLLQTLEMSDAGFDAFDDSMEDGIPTQQVDIQSVFGAADPPESVETKVRPGAMLNDEARVAPGDGSISVFGNTGNSTKSALDALEDPDDGGAPDESVPGLAKSRLSEPDAPLAYPAVTDADASGPRPALASHSAETSGARISVSARAAEAITRQAAGDPMRAVAPAPPRRRASKFVMMGGLAAVAGVIVFVVVTKQGTPAGQATPAPQTSVNTPSAPPAPAEVPTTLEPSSSAQGPASEEPASQAMGALSVICSPDCIDITLHGKSLGPSPLKEHPVPAGTQKITLVRKGMSPSEVEIEIGKDEHVTRSFTMTIPDWPSATPPPQPPLEIDPYED